MDLIPSYNWSRKGETAISFPMKVAAPSPLRRQNVSTALAQEAIEAAEQGDMSGVERLLDASRRPYTVDSDRPELGGKRPDWARNKPGCSALSCSS